MGEQDFYQPPNIQGLDAKPTPVTKAVAKIMRLGDYTLWSECKHVLGSTMLTGDGSYAVWKDGIMKDYTTSRVACTVLMAAHHGSLDFFDDPNGNRYEAHARAMSPSITVVSVGPNNYGHPDPDALKLYEKYSTRSNGNKILRTDKHNTIKVVFKPEGGWTLN